MDIRSMLRRIDGLGTWIGIGSPRERTAWSQALLLPALLLLPMSSSANPPHGSGWSLDPFFPDGVPSDTSLHPRAYLHWNHHHGYRYFSPFRQDLLDPDLYDYPGVWFPPTYPILPFEPSGDEERYRRIRSRGDRARSREDLPRALRHYREAARLATSAWGEGSRQALEARGLADRVSFGMRARGQADPESEPPGARKASRLVELLTVGGEKSLADGDGRGALRRLAQALSLALRDLDPSSPEVARIQRGMEAARASLGDAKEEP